MFLPQEIFDKIINNVHDMNKNQIKKNHYKNLKYVNKELLNSIFYCDFDPGRLIANNKNFQIQVNYCSKCGEVAFPRFEYLLSGICFCPTIIF